MKRLITTVIIMLSISAMAQDMNLVEKMLVNLRQTYLDSAFKSTHEYEYAERFTTEMSYVANNYPTSFDHPFDSLRTKIGIHNSPDNHLRIYSWVHAFGGTWRDIRSFAQYKDSTVFSSLNLCSPLAMESSEYTDVFYSTIQELKNNNEVIYLISGWGTHGAGHHHKTMRAFQYKQGKLSEISALFNGENRIVVEVQRRFTPKLKYDESTLTIEYDEREIKEHGFYEPTGKTIKLKWNGERFTE